ncbi:MAG: hypothetical protein M3442_02995 [Chloroflexota bacterium]|nr:hypothetical protein [Chloroflexota bacterium]
MTETGVKPNILLNREPRARLDVLVREWAAHRAPAGGLGPALVERQVRRSHFDRSLIALGHRARTAHPTSAG